VAVIACDEEGRMTHSSRGARELLGPLPASGASADAWLGELLPRTPEGLPLGLEDLPLTRTLRERIPRESAIRLLTPRGEELLLARAIPLLGEDGTTHLGAAVVLERDRP
jgi:PAS domain-containing protein